MTKRREDPPPAPSLRHSPFAALRPAGAVASSSLSSTPSDPPTPHGAGAGSGASPTRVALVVRREKKGRGGKAVTIAEGAGLAGLDLEALAREAARALGAGARAEHGALVVQGEQTERLVAWLQDRGMGDIVRGN